MTAKQKTEAKAPPSIKAWLRTRLPKGKLTVADALKYASGSGRSEVTVRRMAAELGYRIKAGAFVRAKGKRVDAQNDAIELGMPHLAAPKGKAKRVRR